jgi:hypothetical protein
MFRNLVTNHYTFVIVILRKKLMDLFNLIIEFQGKSLEFQIIHILKSKYFKITFI